MRPTYERGIGLIEAVIASAIMVLVTLGIVAAQAYLVRSTSTATDLIQAQYLLEEGFEAIRLIRDNDWATIEGLSNNVAYTLSFNGAVWSATTTMGIINNRFDRRVTLYPVYRDSSSRDIAESGTLDPLTRRIEVSIAWFDRSATSTRTGTTYLTDLF
ncbi:MAG: hypothetical protein AAB458_02295 [Patescibacteria group bacterium]